MTRTTAHGAYFRTHSAFSIENLKSQQVQSKYFLSEYVPTNKPIWSDIISNEKMIT
jgi:hypothetical protein